MVSVEFGKVTLWLPSFGVLASNSVGNVMPPSVDKVMRTSAVPTGATLVLATSQITVVAAPAARVIAVFGAVITNGPASLSTVMAVEASLVPPPPARLSRTVTRKLSVRSTFASTSPVM